MKYFRNTDIPFYAPVDQKAKKNNIKQPFNVENDNNNLHLKAKDSLILNRNRFNSKFRDLDTELNGKGEKMEKVLDKAKLKVNISESFEDFINNIKPYGEYFNQDLHKKKINLNPEEEDLTQVIKNFEKVLKR